MQIDIPHLFGIRLHSFNRYLLIIDCDILLTVGNPFTEIISEVFDCDFEFSSGNLVGNFVKDINEADDKKKGLIWGVKYEGGEFPDKLELTVRTLAHAFLEIFDGVAVEVGDVEGCVEFVEKVVMGIRVLYNVLDGLFGGNLLNVHIFAHQFEN